MYLWYVTQCVVAIYTVLCTYVMLHTVYCVRMLRYTLGNVTYFMLHTIYKYTYVKLCTTLCTHTTLNTMCISALTLRYTLCLSVYLRDEVYEIIVERVEMRVGVQ